MLKPIIIILFLALVSGLFDVNRGVAQEAPKNIDSVSPPPIDTSNDLIFDPTKDGFDFDGHGKANALKLINPEYIGRLRDAMFNQDYVFQLSSKAHFDNCAFKDGIDYIAKLVGDIEEEVKKAQTLFSRGDSSDGKWAIKDAFFSMGQALHSIQDFYSHSNYVEMMEVEHGMLSDVPIIQLWKPSGLKAVESLQSRGLISGHVWYGHPKYCNASSPSHGELAKDAPDTESGKILVKKWSVTRHAAALHLAKVGTFEFVRYCYDKWPLLKAIGGHGVATPMFVERRDDI